MCFKYHNKCKSAYLVNVNDDGDDDDFTIICASNLGIYRE